MLKLGLLFYTMFFYISTEYDLLASLGKSNQSFTKIKNKKNHKNNLHFSSFPLLYL